MDKKTRARQLKISGHSYKQIGEMLGITPQCAQGYLRIPKGQRPSSECEDCKKPSKILHRHHINYETNEFAVLCPGCHSKRHFPQSSIKQIKAPAKMGRPKLPSGDAKGALFAVRLDDSDSKKVTQAIKRSGFKRPEWGRKALLYVATRGIDLST